MYAQNLLIPQNKYWCHRVASLEKSFTFKMYDAILSCSLQKANNLERGQM